MARRSVGGLGSRSNSQRPFLDVCVSGVHSDPDPSPGVGIAQSLRDAFPRAHLTAIDYSVRSSGLHHPVFDEVRLQPVWMELDLETYASQIREHCQRPGACWISGLDVETDWLAGTVGPHPRLLVPATAAQTEVRKPRLAVASRIGMRVPEFLPATCPLADLHALGRRSGWRLWIKGKYHEAYSARSFAQVRQQVEALELHWPLEDIFVQQHVPGSERCLTFAAYGGRLLDAVEVEKRSVTSQGKTWAAAVAPAASGIREGLALFLAQSKWTGGGEVECIRDHAGVDWLIDFNPRFPAYIYGVTLCGHNLPALLVAEAVGLTLAQPRPGARQFIRVVQEVGVREGFPLPRMPEASAGSGAAGKHPSFQPGLVRRLRGRGGLPRVVHESPPRFLPGFLTTWEEPARTPQRLRDFAAAEAVMEELRGALARCSAHPAVTPALSIKTDPHPQLAEAFLSRGWWAEVISLRELEWARHLGFDASHIVFNGPAAVRLTGSPHQVGVAFADSVETFEALLESRPSDVVGLRLRPGPVRSRFGADLSDFGRFERVVRAMRHRSTGLRLGVHTHFASDSCGPGRWGDLVEHALVWSQALAGASGINLSIFDIGGGWHQDDFAHQFLANLPSLQTRIARALPDVETLLLEPGKAVAADTAWLVTRIIEVRQHASHRDGDIVVDASIADLPMAALYAHRVVHLRRGRCLGWLGGGNLRVLGSVCMENDVLLDGVGFPNPPLVGDELVFSSAGAYNASMAWHFASGISRDA